MSAAGRGAWASRLLGLLLLPLATLLLGRAEASIPRAGDIEAGVPASDTYAARKPALTGATLTALIEAPRPAFSLGATLPPPNLGPSFLPFAAEPALALFPIFTLEPAPRAGRNSRYVTEDELGNVTHLTDQNGQVLERYEYEGYGKFRIFDPVNTPLTASAYGWNRLFQGREYIPLIDAYDFRARTLWPELGRFGQEDPLGAVDSTNLYQALGGRWPTATDPKGHLTIVVHGTWARDDGVDSVEGPRNPSPFYPGGELFDEVRRDTRDYKYISFQWSGSDTDTARVIAAHYLAEKIKRYKFKPDEPLRFVTHSHGGNVVFKAIELGLGRPVDDFVSLSQPFRPDCPAPSVFQVKNFIQVTNDWDPVQNRGGNTIKVPFEIGKASVTTSADHYVTFSWFGLPGAAHAYTRRPEVFRKYLAGLIQPRRLEGKPDEPPTAVWAH